MGSVVLPVADENIAIGVNKFSWTCHECVEGTIGEMKCFKSFQLSHLYILWIYNIYIYIPKVKGALKEFSTQPLFFITLPLNTVPSARFLAQKPVNRAPSFHTLPFSSGSLWYIMCRKSNATESYTNDWLSVLTWQTWNHQSSVYDAQFPSRLGNIEPITWVPKPWRPWAVAGCESRWRVYSNFMIQPESESCLGLTTAQLGLLGTRLRRTEALLFVVPRCVVLPLTSVDCTSPVPVWCGSTSETWFLKQRLEFRWI